MAIFSLNDLRNNFTIMFVGHFLRLVWSLTSCKYAWYYRAAFLT